MKKKVTKAQRVPRKPKFFFCIFGHPKLWNLYFFKQFFDFSFELKQKKNMSDITVKKVDYNFIMNLGHYNRQ